MLSKNLLSSQARIQIPWVKVTIGDYTFGAFVKNDVKKDTEGFYTMYNVQYPNYITGLSIAKINGQVNQYTLNISYPVRPQDDPNFFEKVFSVAGTKYNRKIIFSYGDMSMPTYIYKDEEAVITKVGQDFDIASGVITYTVSAVSAIAVTNGSCGTYEGGKFRPSKKIIDLLVSDTNGIRSNIFTGMDGLSEDSLWKFIEVNEIHDAVVEVQTKTNITILDYINYLVSCMVPEGNTVSNTSSDIWILTIHDDQIYDYSESGSLDSTIDSTEIISLDDGAITGPYFKITKIAYNKEQSDAYEIDIGVNTSTIVTQFRVSNDDSYAIYYDYQGDLTPNNYTRRLNDKGQWEDEYSPTISSKNNLHKTRPEDISWWTKITKYPINATITIQGLLRPANLMTYVRLNVIFPGGNKHISSGLYLVTKQVDTINSQGYRTQLSLTRIGGDVLGSSTYINSGIETFTANLTSVKHL